MGATILCRLSQMVAIQKLLMSAGYGKADITGKTDLAVEMSIYHEQLDTPKNLQKWFRKELKDPTIVVLAEGAR